MGCITYRAVCTIGSTCISYISMVSTSRTVSGWPSERRQICSWWHRRVLFCKQDQYVVLLYTSPLIPAEESIHIATAPYLVLFQLRSVGILCRVCRSTRRHTKRPSSQCWSPWAVSHPRLWPTPSPTKSRRSVRIASERQCSVKCNKQQYCR